MPNIRSTVRSFIAMFVCVAAFAAAPASAQQINGVQGSPGSTKIAHTIPLLMAIDETFDIGSDTRTGVNDAYKLPFHFTGTIDKLTFNLGKEQLTDADRKAIAEKLAKARD